MRAKGGSGGDPPRAMAEDEYFDTAEVAVDRGKDGARDRAATRATRTADDDIIVMVGLLFLRRRRPTVVSLGWGHF